MRGKAYSVGLLMLALVLGAGVAGAGVVQECPALSLETATASASQVEWTYWSADETIAKLEQRLLAKTVGDLTGTELSADWASLPVEVETTAVASEQPTAWTPTATSGESVAVAQPEYTFMIASSAPTASYVGTTPTGTDSVLSMPSQDFAKSGEVILLGRVAAYAVADPVVPVPAAAGLGLLGMALLGGVRRFRRQ